MLQCMHLTKDMEGVNLCGILWYIQQYILWKVLTVTPTLWISNVHHKSAKVTWSFWHK